MQNWVTKLKLRQTSSDITTEPIRILRGIYQGDALSPLWFCLALNPLSELLNKSDLGYKIIRTDPGFSLSHLLYMDDIKLYASSKDELFQLADITQQFSNDIDMEFGVDKCKILSVTRGEVNNFTYALSSGEKIEPMDAHTTYKYLGFEQSRKIKHKDTKSILIKKFNHRLNLLLKSELNSKNTIKAVNTFAIPILTYSFGIINWSKTDLNKLQRMINTTMTKHRKHHPKSAIERLVLPRQEGGRGIIDINNLHNKQITTLRNYFYGKAEHSSLHKGVVELDVKLTPLNLQNTQQQQNEILVDNKTKIKQWAEKSLHGRHQSDLSLSHVDAEKSNQWLKRGELFPETEGFMIAIQDQVIATRNYKKYILKDKNQQTDLCRRCNSASETIQHITGACASLVQNDYKHRHDQVASILHQHLCHHYKFIKKKIPYYKYKPETIVENKNYKIYWDRTIITDKTVHFNRPDITLHDKNNSTVYIIDIAIPNTHNIQTTTSEKLNKYQELAIEIKNLWKVNAVYIIPIIISTTGVIPKVITQNLEILHAPPHTLTLIQKATILNTCRITRKFLTSARISNNSHIPY
ncbi:hypothetical protein K1T71_007862 [Dendrolimus kikuchii]|uniref:Uncharacterized protein n=1 Tax=Dendrolimus kikuchii TaxID=765133 RepID=A0ACC1CZC1_9NEOP|nr:hypothetical protein K1T71_007862 [Dendrolimus kikuchii]